MSENELTQKQRIERKPMQPWVKKKTAPAPEAPEGNEEQEPEMNDEEESEEDEADEEEDTERTDDLKIKDRLK